MKQLAIVLRIMQLYTHNAHNLAKGPTFLEDHGFLGDLYGAYEADYDDVVERIIGLGQEIDLVEVQNIAANTLVSLKQETKSNKDFFLAILGLEQKLCSIIEGYKEGYTQGTIQLVGDIANKSEVRQYKLKRRLG